MTSDSNYDNGSLYVESDGRWLLIAPTDPGPQPYNPGGEVVLWESLDQGNTWNRIRNLTAGSPYNHGYCRRPIRAHPQFYAFWADGHARRGCRNLDCIFVIAKGTCTDFHPRWKRILLALNW